MKITVEMLMQWDPCPNYTEEKIRDLGGDGLTPLEICTLPIPVADRLWVLLRKEIIPEKELNLFACRFAEDALTKIANPDQRSLNAIKTKRLFVDGKATDKELQAALVAAREAVRIATWLAARSADRVAAWLAAIAAIAAAAGAAARAAARAAEAAAWLAAGSAARAARAAALKKYLKWVQCFLIKAEK